MLRKMDLSTASNKPRFELLTDASLEGEGDKELNL
jgi:hypothetical protein